MDLSRIATALRHCGRAKHFNAGKSLHSNSIKLGVADNVYVANNLISMYVGFQDSKDARKVFDEIPHKNIVTWTTMVSSYTDLGRPQEALALYQHVLDSESETSNGFLYSAALKACALSGDLELGKSIHEGIVLAGLESDTVLMNALLDMYVKCGSLRDAVKAFAGVSSANSTTWNTILSGYAKQGLMIEAVDFLRRMPEPNAVSWNTVVAGFSEKGSLKAVEFGREMHGNGLRLDGFTFPCLLKTCGRYGLEALGKTIHGLAVKSGSESGRFTASAFIDFYSDCFDLVSASKLFRRFSSSSVGRDDLVLWNSMLSGYVLNKCYTKAFEAVSAIQSSTKMDSYTLSSALKACVNTSSSRLGLQVHALVATLGYQSDRMVGSVIVDLYARLGKIDRALSLFRGLHSKDSVAWSGLISGCCNSGLNVTALSLFREMIELNPLEVDQFAISSAVKACSASTSLGIGKQIHGRSAKMGFASEEVVTTSLIDMYAKCGEIEDALVLFRGLRESERDVVCWTAIIVGLGQNGRAREAAGAFREMRESGLKPNGVTYLAALSACRHGGLVEEAREIFGSMRLRNGVEPCVEHFGCFLDILSRGGFSEEAKKLAAEMPFEPNDSIRRSLMIADPTAVIGKEMITGDRSTSTYVTLSNVYAGLGMWDKLSRVREISRNLGSKQPGKSWVQL